MLSSLLANSWLYSHFCNFKLRALPPSLCFGPGAAGRCAANCCVDLAGRVRNDKAGNNDPERINNYEVEPEVEPLGSRVHKSCISGQVGECM